MIRYLGAPKLVSTLSRLLVLTHCQRCRISAASKATASLRVAGICAAIAFRAIGSSYCRLPTPYAERKVWAHMCPIITRHAACREHRTAALRNTPPSCAKGHSPPDSRSTPP
eukprot:360774-Chlamydomonas_euryale.AAC.15